MPVTVIIVNYNSRWMLSRCLSHLSRQTFPPRRIIVVDNASTDGSEKVADTLEQVKVLKMTANIGFAAANNRALVECNTPFVVLLNPDAFPQSDWLETLLDASQKNPEYAMFGSRLVAVENPGRLDGDGDCYHISGVVWRDGHGCEFKSEKEPWEAFSPCAAAALYRTEDLHQVGGFDEDFFCYLEDVDLGFRLRLMGQRCLHVPTAIVHHMGSATTGGQRGGFATYHGHRNLVWTYFKNMPSPLFWLFLPLHLAANLISIFIGLLRGQGAVIMKAKRDAFIGLPQMLGKRRVIQRNKTATAREIFKVLNKKIFRNTAVQNN